MLEKEILQFIKDDIKEIKDDFKDLSHKVDELLQFKWRIIGASFLASILLTGLFQLVLAIVTK